MCNPSPALRCTSAIDAAHPSAPTLLVPEKSDSSHLVCSSFTRGAGGRPALPKPLLTLPRPRPRRPPESAFRRFLRFLARFRLLKNAPGVRSVKRGSWFNPEVLTNQKREYTSQFKDKKKVVEWPDHCFEHFIIVGLPPTTDVKVPSSRSEFGEPAMDAASQSQQNDAHGAPLPGQILFSYPPDKPVNGDVVSFCFPHGVQPRLLERTPSMSALNELVYSQQYAHDDAVSFVFLLKAADNLPLYGVCCYMEEMVHRPPAVLASAYPQCMKPLSRYLVAAPRCYVFLTHFPFFSLHMKVLHMMMGLERMDRMRMFADELTAVAPPVSRTFQTNSVSASRRRVHDADDDAFSIRSSTSGHVQPAPHHARGTSAGVVHDLRRSSDAAEQRRSVDVMPGEESGLQKAQSEDLSSFTTLQRIAEALGDVSRDDLSEAGLLDEGLELQDTVANSTAGYAELTAMVRNSALAGSGPNSQRNSFDRPPGGPGSVVSNHSAASGADAIHRASARTRLAAGQRPELQQSNPIPEEETMRSTSFELPDEEAHAAEVGSNASFDPTEPSTAVALKVMHNYYHSRVPEPGKDWDFRPDPSLQSIQYYRFKVGEPAPGGNPRLVSISTAEAEAAEGLCTWTVAMLCRALTLPNILTLLTAVLLERQTVVFCPNIGVLTAVVLALIPLVRPFAWQSLMLPVLPATEEMLDLLQAPVPFVVGVQEKTADVRALCGGLVRVNVYKDSVKGSATLPTLPGDRALMQKLQPSYNVLSNIGRRQTHGQPLYAVTGIQRTAAEGFLQNMRFYLTQLTSNLPKHTITSVQHDDRVSVLLKDSFIESFAPKERPFVRQFVETQMFTEFVDAVID